MFKRNFSCHIFMLLFFGVLVGCNNSTFSGIVPSSSEENTSGDSVRDGEFSDQNDSDSSGSFGPGISTEQNEIFADARLQTSSCKTLRDANLDDVKYFSPNMVPDGDFESSNTEIESDYAYNGLSSCVDSNSLIPDIGEYAIVVNP